MMSSKIHHCCYGRCVIANRCDHKQVNLNINILNKYFHKKTFCLHANKPQPSININNVFKDLSKLKSVDSRCLKACQDLSRLLNIRFSSCNFFSFHNFLIKTDFIKHILVWMSQDPERCQQLMMPFRSKVEIYFPNDKVEILKTADRDFHDDRSRF